MAKKLFEINPSIDRAAAAARFAVDKRVQVRDVLTRETAEEIRTILARHTPWGLAMQAGETGKPHQVLAPELPTPAGKQRLQEHGKAVHEAAARGEYAFVYGQYSLLQDVQEGWNPDGPHQFLLEYLNTDDFLGLVREVTGERDLIKADGQATLYAQNHFLGLHIDSHVLEGWRVAYVMNFTIDQWHPHWGGYLQFHDEGGDIVEAYMPRFNSLNLFLVPQPHSVSMIAPFAPHGRYAITGWLRDR